jgi:hypothetical protein
MANVAFNSVAMLTLFVQRVQAVQNVQTVRVVIEALTRHAVANLTTSMKKRNASIKAS